MAAGNKDKDANQVFLASTKDATTAGATDWYRKRAKFSDYGAAGSIFVKGIWLILTSTGLLFLAVRSGTSISPTCVAGSVLYIEGLEDMHDAKATFRQL